MTLWAKYLKQRLGVESIENEFGFLTYCANSGHILLCDFYVDDERRNSGIARSLFDSLMNRARSLEKKEIRAEIWVGFPGAELALSIAIYGGFKVLKSDLEKIIISKEVEYG